MAYGMITCQVACGLFDIILYKCSQVTVVPNEDSGESPEPQYKDKEKAEKENIEEGRLYRVRFVQR